MIGRAFCWTCGKEQPADLDLHLCGVCGRDPFVRKAPPPVKDEPPHATNADLFGPSEA